MWTKLKLKTTGVPILLCFISKSPIRLSQRLEKKKKIPLCFQQGEKKSNYFEISQSILFSLIRPALGQREYYAK